MKEDFRVKILFCFLALLILLLIPSVSAYGVGLGPSELQITNALRGTSVERSVTVFNLGDTVTAINLTAEGAGADWIRFYDGDTKSAPVTSVSMKAREIRPIIIQVNIPEDTANGVYTPTIHATINPLQSTKIDQSVSAILEATTALTITVTGEQKIAGTVEYIMVDNTEINYPLPIKVLFHNTGNVAAKPDIKATISKNSGNIDTIASSETEVKAGDTQLIIVRWTKTNIDSGNYTADVTVGLEGSQIAHEVKTFKIEPVGTLSRQGNLTDLIYSGRPGTDPILKIIGTFQNTGTIETKAKMIGEVYRDNTLVDTFTTDELSISMNEKGELLYYLKVQAPGTYSIKAYVLYDGKKTDTKELEFSTITGGAPVSSASAGQKSPLPLSLAIISITGCIALIVFSRRHSR
jgi:hypothetical protein